MPVTSADLWKLLRQSHLLSADRLEQVRSAFAQSGSQPDQVPAKAFAQWLVQRQLLTPYQVRTLLNGRSGPFRYGEYLVQDRIRSGRFAKTFTAVHVPTQFGVQLKFASNRIAQDPRQWNAARQHVRTTSPIVHDQLQRVFALQDEASYRFLIMERLAGTSLRELLDAGDTPAVSETCRIVRLAALGLDELHEHGQVYGDVRPDNLWLESHGNVKLLRDSLQPPILPTLLQSGLTETQVAQLDYLAPELVHPGTPLSQATDIYALGCTLYELLQGRMPFAGGEPTEQMERRAVEPVPPIDAVELPEPLAQLVTSLLASEPAGRPNAALEIAEELLPFVTTSMRSIPQNGIPATLLAFEQALGQTPAAPAPPPVTPDPDDHPRLPEPPVQSLAPPPNQPPNQPPGKQSVEPAEAAAQPSEVTHKIIEVVADPRRPNARIRRHHKQRTRRRQAILLSMLALGLVVVAGAIVVFNSGVRDTLLGSRQRKPSGGPSGEHVGGTGGAKGDGRRQSPSAETDKTNRTDAGSDAAPTLARYTIGQDDGKRLWLPPTNGSPVALRFVAPGAQWLLICRPHAIMNSAQGAKVLQALGPGLAEGQRSLESATGVAMDQIAQLVIALHVTDSAPQVSMIVQLREPHAEADLLAGWGAPTAASYHDQTYYNGERWSFFVPAQDSVTEFVIGNKTLIEEVIDVEDAAPLLRREMARLLHSSDSDRHLSLLFAPSFLVHDLLQDPNSFVDAPRLRETVAWLLADGVKACLLSMHFDEDFFVELRAYGQANIDSPAVADALRRRIGESPDRIESVFEQIYPPLYWRRVALRFPEMIRFLHRHTRVGVEEEQAIVNAWLPGHAAHNLLFGAQMLLATENDRVAASKEAPTVSPAPSVPATIQELLERSMDLSFAQKSLEFAIEDLATDIREAYPVLPFPFAIQILGSDLQLNGITRNQQISQFTAQNKTIAEILTSIVMRANPVASVTDPSAPDQKLVWVVGPAPDDPKKQVLLITTRDAAQREGYKLPASFQRK